jgi:class 3 adenylate cyclase
MGLIAMETQSYEVQVLKGGKWEVARVFAPDDKVTADSLFVSLTAEMGYQGKKLIAEVMDGEGTVKAKTLSVQVFDPKGGGGAGASSAGSAGVTGFSSPGRGAAMKSGNANPFKAFLDFLLTLGKGFRFGDARSIAPSKTAPVAKFANPAQVTKANRDINPNSTAYETKYPDEDQTLKEEIIGLENQEILGTDFFEYIQANLINEELTTNTTQAVGVFCFTIGALIRIESGIDLASDRGRAILYKTLEMLMFSSEDIEDFMARMMSLLTHDGGRRFIKAGARCLDYHQQARTEDLIATFRKSFGLAGSEDDELGITEDIGIVFTDIVDSTQLNAEIGDFKSQKVVDHHEQVIRENCAKHGGRILKHLGDGFMLAFHDSREMVRFIHSVLWQYRAEEHPADVDPYKIRLGGHFGQAIEKNGDYFGSTVALAARVAASAGELQGSLLNEYREIAETAGLRIVDQKNVELKGFKDKFTIILLN